MDKIKFLVLDFEFYNSQERSPTLVCCHCAAITADEPEHHKTFWLHNDPTAHAKFRAMIERAISENYVFIAWSGSAEMKCLLSLDIELDALRLVDAQVEYKIINYTRHFDGMRNKSSLAQASSQLLKQEIEEKPGMIDLILSAERGYEYTPEDIELIEMYCANDVKITIAVYKHILSLMKNWIGIRENYLDVALNRGAYVKATAYIERHGYPISKPRLNAVVQNYTSIKQALLYSAPDDVRRCYKQENKKGIINFVLKASEIDQAIRLNALDTIWPKTETGRWSTDSQWFSGNKGVHRFVDELGSLKRKMDCLKYLNANGTHRSFILDVIGQDARARGYVNPYGTITGRNAPPASTFIPAQSSWERVLIEPPPGRVILGFDYSAQEILIQGLTSSDDAMIETYLSGDPYMAFGIKSGLLPAEATRLDPEVNRYRSAILKPAFLGLGYGMQAEKLSKYLTITMQEAIEIYRAHQNLYHVYWENVREFLRSWTRNQTYYPLGDDWGFCDVDRYGTLLNWRIQAYGGYVLRKLAIEFTSAKWRARFVNPIILLHDAIYLEANDFDDLDALSAEVKELMITIFHNILPSEKGRIRVDSKAIKHGDFWIEEKAENDWKILSRFFEQ